MNRHVFTLLFVTLVWGATFPVLKLATAHLSGVEITALRFLIASVCVAPFALRASRDTWRDGAVLGAIALVSYVTQAYGLQFISSNRSAFITSLNVLMVPLLGMAFGRRPTLLMLFAAAMACAGIGLMSWDGGGHLVADLATVLSAFTYALYVVVLSRRTGLHAPQQLAATQIFSMALLGVIWMLIEDGGSGTVLTLVDRIDTPTLLGLLYLGLIASAGMLFLMALAQRHVPAEKAAVIYAMEPVFAALFAWAWLAEVMSARAALGGAIVVVAVLLSESPGATKPRTTPPT